MLKTFYNTEIKACYVVWISSVFYAIYSFTNTTSKFFGSYHDIYDDLTEGWEFLGRKRDKSDVEWETINYFIHSVVPWIILFIFSSETLRQTSINHKTFKLWQITFTLSVILLKFGVIPLGVLLFQPVTFAFCSSFHMKTVQWLWNLLCIVIISFYKQVSASEDFVKYLRLNEFSAYVIILGLCWTNLRCTSYTLSNIHSDLTVDNLLNLFAYCLYLPTFFCGPFIPFEDYESLFEETKQLPLKTRCYNLCRNLCRCGFWFIFASVVLHFIYVNATGFQPELVKGFDAWTLYGYGYTMGQFFHVKYVVLYGITTALAKFENVTVPALPRCIGRVHLYSDMWKYFDPGLHKFLVQYIYVPSLNALGKLFASLLCFCFVFIWHGVEKYILIWAFFNYLGITIEYLSEVTEDHLHIFKKFSPVWSTRIKCVLASPLLCLSCISNFYFFAGYDIGNIFVSKILNDDFLTNTMLICILYCCCQVCTDLRAVNANKM